MHFTPIKILPTNIGIGVVSDGETGCVLIPKGTPYLGGEPRERTLFTRAPDRILLPLYEDLLEGKPLAGATQLGEVNVDLEDGGVPTGTAVTVGLRLLENRSLELTVRLPNRPALTRTNHPPTWESAGVPDESWQAEIEQAIRLGDSFLDGYAPYVSGGLARALSDILAQAADALSQGNCLQAEIARRSIFQAVFDWEHRAAPLFLADCYLRDPALPPAVRHVLGLIACRLRRAVREDCHRPAPSTTRAIVLLTEALQMILVAARDRLPSLVPPPPRPGLLGTSRTDQEAAANDLGRKAEDWLVQRVAGVLRQLEASLDQLCEGVLVPPPPPADELVPDEVERICYSLQSRKSGPSEATVSYLSQAGAGVQVPPGVAGGVGPRAAATAGADPVDFTVFAPPAVAAGQAILVQVFAHTPEQAEAAGAMAREFDEEARRLGFQSLELDVERGAALTLELALPGIEVDDPARRLIWRGRPAAVQFGVEIPAGHPPGVVIGTVRAYLEDVPVGHIKFKLKIAAAPSDQPPRPVGDQARRYQVAFISYASADRVEVLKRVQILARCGVRFFQDVLHLEPGDRWQQELYRRIDQCDLFLLFWSTAAKGSEWVAREVEYALSRKGADDLAPPEVVPVPLEGPPVPEPPPRLAHLHFNDALLYFLSASRRPQ